MARKITLFELYFDGIQFGSRGDEEPDADEPAFDPVDEDETSGRSRVRPALAAMGVLAVVSAAGVMAFRRFRGDADEEFEFDEPGDYEADDYESVGHAEDHDEAMLD